MQRHPLHKGEFFDDGTYIIALDLFAWQAPIIFQIMVQIWNIWIYGDREKNTLNEQAWTINEFPVYSPTSVLME